MMTKFRIEPYLMWSRYAAKATDQVIRNVKRMNCRTFLLSMFQQRGLNTNQANYALHHHRYAEYSDESPKRRKHQSAEKREVMRIVNAVRTKILFVVKSEN